MIAAQGKVCVGIEANAAICADVGACGVAPKLWVAAEWFQNHELGFSWNEVAELTKPDFKIESDDLVVFDVANTIKNRDFASIHTKAHLWHKNFAEVVAHEHIRQVGHANACGPAKDSDVERCHFCFV